MTTDCVTNRKLSLTSSAGVQTFAHLGRLEMERIELRDKRAHQIFIDILAKYYRHKIAFIRSML